MRVTGRERRFPIRRRKEARPGELVRAAQGIFVERGFAATRLDDVAARAGVSKGTIYLYFRSKEALFKAIIEAGLAPAIERIEALEVPTAKIDRPAVELLHSYLEAWLCIMGRTPAGSLLKLLLAESGNFPEIVAWFNDSVVCRAKRLMTCIVEAGIANGDFYPVSPQTVVDMFFSPICLYAFGDVWGELSSPDRFLKDAFALLTRGLVKAAHERPDPEFTWEMKYNAEHSRE